MMAILFGWWMVILPPIGVENYHHNEGLAVQDVYGVLIGTDGMVWLHTDNGLIRFDGSRFRTVQATSGKDVVVAQTLGDSLIAAFTFDNEVILQPVDRLGNSRRIQFPDSLRPRSFVHAMGVDASRQVIGTTQSRLLINENHGWRSVDLPNRTAVPIRIPLVHPVSSGWVIGTSDGLWLWRTEGFILVDEQVRIVGKPTIDSSTVWIPDRTHLIRWSDEVAVRMFPFKTFGLRNVVTQVVWRKPDELWMATLDEGLLVVKFADDGSFRIEKKLTQMKVSGVAKAKDGTLWVTTLGNGVFRFHSWFDAFSNVDVPSVDPVIFAAEVDGFGYVVAHAIHGVYARIGSQWKRILSAPVTDIEQIGPGLLIVSSGEMAVLLHSDGRRTDLMKTFVRSGFILNPPVKSAELVGHRLILALPVGVFEWNLRSDSVRALNEGRATAAGFIGSERVLITRPDRLEVWSKDMDRQVGELSIGASGFVRVSQEVLLVASPQEGLGLLDLESLGWKQIHDGDVKEVWRLSENLFATVGADGLTLLEKTDNGMEFQSIRVPMTPDGIAQSIRSVWMDDDGLLHIASRIGVFTVSVSAIKEFNIKPVIRIVELSVDGEERSRSLRVELAPNQRSVGIVLAVDGLQSHRRSLLEYRQGNGSWTPLPGMTIVLDQVDVGLTEISFRIRLDSNNEPEVATTLQINRQPKWWELAWVRSLFVLMIVMMIATGGMWLQKRLNRRRIEQFKEEDRLRHMERMALTQLLTSHFLFNTLSTIRSVAVRSVDEVQAYVGRLARVIRSLIDRSYELEVDLSTELEWIRDYVAVEAVGRGVEIGFNVTGLGESETDDVMLPSFVLQPLVENAIIHGRVENGRLDIECEIKVMGTLITITLTNRSDSTSESRSNGAGLNLVRDRMKGWARYHGVELSTEEILSTRVEGELWRVRLGIPNSNR